MKKLKVMTVFGTRPEAIKMAPLVKALEANPAIESSVCVTAQHREMLDQVLDIFRIRPDYDLNIMQERQTLADITTRALNGLYEVFGEAAPDIVLVHGDTTTTFAASLAAYYLKIKVGHVEAGLRTHDKYYPYPEEMNRKLTGAIADLHFAPTESNRDNLLREGINRDRIYVTGNTVIDALSTTVSRDFVFGDPFLKGFDFEGKRVIAMTAHRRENIGRPFEEIFSAVRRIADEYPDIHIVYPVHLNPLVSEPAERILGNHPRIHLITPVNVQEMHNLMARSYIVLTDSGGLQEEAPALGKPVLVLRNETERPEAVRAGTVRLAGTRYESVYRTTKELLDREDVYFKMAKAVNPYGDGKASRRIVEGLLHGLGLSGSRPEEFAASY
ncbi:MAG TPA: UDP-N-acetylglucosamine 2-epimerase (non-hydrolyzing) [Thermoclostridium sp.]|nr:UDP-N-acetylglucosamine 2-epimerase (non-hydrolyzing) [Thermoclostridium sp.]HPU45504.1 UDP-N-acetylglucosamine 2-epimerase (non-hydrolyzing) [Thermoclostridium sp.]